tara:strand:- start:213 stop:764 length:552 start_codon:yes stop_codon:yes gene_type:complete
MTTSTSTLQKIMSLVDNHSDEIPEGDYLEICNTLRDMSRNNRRIRILPPRLRENPLDTIIGRCMALVRERKVIKNGLKTCKKRYRLTKSVKKEALDAYCYALELPICETLEELQELGYASNSDDFFKEYLRFTNEFRQGQRETFIRNLDSIENEMQTICSFMRINQDIINSFYEINLDVANLS